MDERASAERKFGRYRAERCAAKQLRVARVPALPRSRALKADLAQDDGDDDVVDTGAVDVVRWPKTRAAREDIA